MKIWGKLTVILIFLVTLLLTGGALAGEAGTVTCIHPGCGYHINLQIGGGIRTPAITGYCPQEKQFVRLKIKSGADYRQPHYCPGGEERLVPIYGGADVAKIPCPKCGNLTLKYKRKLLFD